MSLLSQVLRTIVWILLVFLLIGSPVAAQLDQPGITTCDIEALIEEHAAYDTCSSGCSVSSVGPGVLPASVPEPLNGIATAAGQKFGVPPALIAAIYYVENNGKQGTDATQYKWREPPPPYGKGSPWLVSSAGAKGPFQFLAGTWARQGVDGNGDGKTDVLDLTDAAFGAAKYLKYLMGQASGDIKSAAGGYEAGSPTQSEYGDDAYALYQYFSGGSSDGSSTANVTPSCSGGSGDVGGYRNPLRDVSDVGDAGIDAGVDYTGSGPVYALGNGTVVYASNNSGWVGGHAVAYTLKDGVAAGKTVYVAENCPVEPGLKVGDTVTSDTVICRMINTYPYIETGWANTNSDVPKAYIDKCYYIANPSITAKTSTAYGVNFDKLMTKLGAPKASLLAPPVTCTLPAGWPSW